MKPKLKENPREWQIFTASMSAVFGAVTLLAWSRGTLSLRLAGLILGSIGLALMFCALRPRWFRGFYRAGMTAGFYFGQFVGRILLTVLFCFVLVPLAVCLRVTGKDLLRLKRDPAAKSYWLPARTTDQFERMF